jgi:hypothetical protein
VWQRPGDGVPEGPHAFARRATPCRATSDAAKCATGAEERTDREQFDRTAAGAEAQLDRFDEAPSTERASAASVHPHDYGMHVDDPEADLLADDLDVGLRDDVEADAIDTLAEAFNARDLESLLDIVAPDGEAPGLLGYDVDNLPQRHRGPLAAAPDRVPHPRHPGTEHVGVLWEHDGKDWWRLAVVHVDDVHDGHVGVLEFSDDTALLEQVDCSVPDDDLDEGARWAEWAEGADGASPTS